MRYIIFTIVAIIVLCPLAFAGEKTVPMAERVELVQLENKILTLEKKISDAEFLLLRLRNTYNNKNAELSGLREQLRALQVEKDRLVDKITQGGKYELDQQEWTLKRKEKEKEGSGGDKK